MNKIDSYTSLLVEDDFEYLAKKYDLAISVVRTMNDSEWQAYLGCGKDELAFYLLEDNSYQDVLAMTEAFEELDEQYDDEMDTLFEDSDLSESIIDLARERERLLAPATPHKTWVETTNERRLANGQKPYVFTPKPKKKKTVKPPHALQVVY